MSHAKASSHSGVVGDLQFRRDVVHGFRIVSLPCKYKHEFRRKINLNRTLLKLSCNESSLQWQKQIVN